MQYFLLCLFLTCSYNVHATNINVLEEVTNKPDIKPCKSSLSDKDTFSSDSLEAENTSLVGQNSLTQDRKNVALNLKGRISREDITRLGDKQYKKISLYRAYSQEDLPCFNNDAFIVSPATFNPDVRHLSLRLCGLTDGHIEEIGQFKKLRKLKLHTNSITERGIDFISSLTQLKILDLGANNINDSGVEKLSLMTNLTELDISNNKEVTGNSLNYISNLTNLKNLNIQRTSITREEVVEFKKYSTYLTKLNYLPRFSNH